MHPDQNRLNQILVKCTSTNQIPSFITELTGIVQKDVQSFAKPAESQEYFQELQTALNAGLNKVNDPALKTALKTQISNFITQQQKGAGAAPGRPQY